MRLMRYGLVFAAVCALGWVLLRGGLQYVRCGIGKKSSSEAAICGRELGALVPIAETVAANGLADTLTRFVGSFK